LATALSWSAAGIRLGEVDAALARLRAEAAQEHPGMRTSVMTHLAWVPEAWLERAREALSGMDERHPSRTVILVPEPHAGDGRLDASVSLVSFQVPDADRRMVSEVIELRLVGPRAQAPASVVEPLLISDLPVFLRWRGEPPWGAAELEQLVQVADRLSVDSTEWEDDLTHAYERLSELFERAAVSDIAWARTSRWRSLLAGLWPEIASVSNVRVHGTLPQTLLIGGWLRSRLERDDIRVEHVPADRLEGIDLDGSPAPFPPGDLPLPSDVLSDELDRFTRDPVYEAAVRAV
jgi:glucose-6-phosphate dehydrogenase assembly protein OpcA